MAAASALFPMKRIKAFKARHCHKHVRKIVAQELDIRPVGGIVQEKLEYKAMDEEEDEEGPKAVSIVTRL